MTSRIGIPAVLLVAASAGWTFCPPRPAAPAVNVVVRQLRDDGRTVAALRAAERERTLAQLAPFLSVGLLLGGVASALAHASRCGVRT